MDCSQNFSKFRRSFPKVQRYAIIWFLIFNCGPLKGAFLILEKFFSSSSFYDTACFSILVRGPHLDATIISENVLRRSGIDAIIFNCGQFIWSFSCFRILFQLIQYSAFNQTFQVSFIGIFFRMVQNEKTYRRSSVKYRTFSEVPT